MFSGSITTQKIKDAARRELKGVNEELLNRLDEWIDLILKKWKFEHGDRHPKSMGQGLLSIAGAPISFEDAQPWQCASLPFPSRLGLAQRLWVENNPDFHKMLRKTNQRKVLALLIATAPDNVNQDELFSAYEFLVNLQRLRSMQDGANNAWEQLQPTIGTAAKYTRSQTAKAEKLRKPDITKASLLEFRDSFAGRNGKYQGWKKLACAKFQVSLKTLNKRIKE